MNENTDVYFTFFLGEGAFAIDVQSVKEVLTFESITTVPRAAPYMRGVMNIRGSVVSIIDFRTLFNIPSTTAENELSIIVTEVDAEGDSPLCFGVIADKVEEVESLDMLDRSDSIMGGDLSLSNQFIKKLGKKGDQFVLILDMEKILRYIEDDLAQQNRA